MSHIEAPDASGKIDEDVAIDVFQQRAFGPGDIDRRGVREAARNGLFPPLRAAPASVARELQYVSESLPSQYHPIGCSFRLMWTCLVSRYSSMPHGPSSRPKPDCL